MNLRNWLRYALFSDTTMHGEFRALQKLAGPGCPRSLVDVGANDGFGASNSFPFIARGWRALLLEPHPEAFARARRLHAKNPRVTCLEVACGESAGPRPLFYGADGDEGTLATLRTEDNPHTVKVRTGRSAIVQVDTLAHVLETQAWARDFGLLSIDTEGFDGQVLRGLDLARWRPRIIITEDYFDNEAKFDLLRRHGYELRGQLHCNTVWTCPPPG